MSIEIMVTKSANIVFYLFFTVISTFSFFQGCSIQANSYDEQVEVDQGDVTNSLIQDVATDRWQCSTKLVQPGATFDFSRFFDEDHGIAASSTGIIYKIDLSRGVELNKVGLQKGGRVASFDFISKQIGWLVAVYQDGNSRVKKSVVLRTSNGGEKWISQIERDDIEFSQIRFWDNHNGWIVGRTSPSNRSVMPVEPVLFFTSDGGQTWNRYSRPLSRQALSGYDAVVPYEPDRAIILTSLGEFYRLSSTGEFVEKLPMWTERDQTFISQIDHADSGIRIVGGADSKEGIWGIVAAYDGRWHEFSVPGTNIKSAVFISNDEILLSGYEKSNRSISDQLASYKSVILYSDSGGKVFENICGDKSFSDVVALKQIDANTILGVAGDSVYRIDRQP